MFTNVNNKKLRNRVKGSIDFVQLPVTLNPQIDNAEEATLKLELSFSHGEQLRISGQITPTLLSTLIKEMRA